MSQVWQFDSSQQAELPMDLWKKTQGDLAKAKTIEEESRKKKKNKKRKPQGALLMHFTYSLKDGKFLRGHVGEYSNLYFVYADLMKEDVSQDYIVVQMDDEDLETTATPSRFSYDVDPMRELILRNGIVVDSQDETSNAYFIYHLIGCSNSQVQKHCYIFRCSTDLQSNEARLRKILPNLLELEKKKGIPKRVKYTGLLFSGITPVKLPKDTVVEEIKSYKNDRFDFTDGPGLISRKLAVWVKDQLGFAGECPSVFQIRYCGVICRVNGEESGFVCKGVLVVDPRNDDTHVIQVRSSMLKIKSSSQACEELQCTLGICDYSQPIPGRLGQQLACLLSSNVGREDLIKLQTEHLKAVANALKDPFSMAWVLALDRRQHVWQNFQKLLLLEIERADSQNQKDVPRLYKKCAEAVINNCDKLLSEKVQLPLAASRTLFGAVIPEVLHNELGEGDCIVLLEDGPLRLSSSDEAFVIVSRSPSYYPGDIRVLRLISLPDNHPIYELRNCILFSTRGDRPDPDKMGGGDLDGDKYLVIWHPHLLKFSRRLRPIQPAFYDDSGPNDTKSATGEGDWIHYAAQTDNSMLGEVERTFYKLAKQFGIDSTSIAELNGLFASLVDRHPTSLVAFNKLKSSVTRDVSSSASVWEEMATLQKECISKQIPCFQSRDFQSQYTAFQKATKKIAINPTAFTRKAIDDFGYHFLETLRRRDVSKTLSEISLLQKPERGDDLNTEYAMEDDKIKEEGILERRETTSVERKHLLQLEEPVRQFFEPHITGLAKLILPHQEVIHEQEQREQEICMKKDEHISQLTERDEELEKEHTRLTSEHEVWRQSRQHYWGSLRAKKEDESALKLNMPRVRLERRLLALEESREQLRIANNKLDNMWFFLVEGWSASKTAAAEDKQQKQRRFENEKQMCVSLEREIKDGEGALQKVVSETEDAFCREEYEKRKWLDDELVSIGKERRQLAKEKDACMERFHSDMNGVERDRLEALVDEKMAELLLLREREDPSGGEDVNQRNNDKSTNYVSALINEVKKLAAKIAAMFSPQTLSEARAAITEPTEQMESAKLGRSHVLHKIAQAKLMWEHYLQSGTTTKSQQRGEWKALLATLNRIFDLEKNRLLGFPSGAIRKPSMPVYHKRSLLRDILRNSQALIITAGTGCGKSTQIPQYIADDFYSYIQQDKAVRVCCTQPRRGAAQGLAKRVAEEYKTKLGELVGFKIGSRGRSRDECEKVSGNTVIEFVTEGLLLFNMAKSFEFLKQYDCVIVDEMHERNAEQDLCLALLRTYLESQECRPSFKVVIMSASIDARRFSEYFHGCPVLDCPGRNYPVEEAYMPFDTAIDDLTSYAVRVLFEEIIHGAGDAPGDVLIFLSGSSEIEECVSKIQARARTEGALVVAYPLYSRLAQDDISAATDPQHRVGLQEEMKALKGKGKHLAGVRKVICCTNIAETSLTIDGVQYVIDSGLAKKLRYDHSLRCTTLGEDWVSYASTLQRKGRAGRTNSGTCFYLYSEEHHKSVMKPYDTPSILERPVDELILLSLSACSRSIEELNLLDSPSSDDVIQAKARLLDLDFIQENTGNSSSVSLTSSGQVACSLSFIRPESVRMMLNACEKFPRHATRGIKLAVLLSTTESVFDRKLVVHEEDKEISSSQVFGDHLLALEHLEWFEKASKTTKNGKNQTIKNKCRGRGLNVKILKSIQEDVETCHRQLKRLKLFPSVGDAKDSGDFDPFDNSVLFRILISGYFFNLVQCFDLSSINKAACSYVSNPGLSVFLDRGSLLNASLDVDQQEQTFLNDDAYQTTDNDSDGMLDTNSTFSISRDYVKPRFLVYGNLTKVRKTGNAYMLDVSVLEGQIAHEEAPERWLERVSFQPNLDNMCRITIRNIGPAVLSECSKKQQDFFEHVQGQSGADLLFPSREDGFVRIGGTQNAVSAAQARIESMITSVLKEKNRVDKAHNKKTGLLFGSGMQVKGLGHQSNKAIQEVVRAFGTNVRELSNCRNVADIKVDQKKNVIFARPLRNTSLTGLETLLNSIGVVAFRLKRDKDRFIVKVQPQNNGNSHRIESCADILKQHKALSAETIHCGSFLVTSAQKVFRALGQEASNKSIFWQSFQQTLFVSNGRKKSPVCFVPSQECFVFGPRNSESQALASKFRGLVDKLSNTLEYYIVEKDGGFKRYQVRRFASILAELQKSLPHALLYRSGVKPLGRDEKAVMLKDESLPDFTCLVQTAKSEGVQSIHMWYAVAAVKQKSMLKSLLHEKLSIEALEADSSSISEIAPKGSEWNMCVMCRRGVLVRFWKKDKDKAAVAGALEGWRLTLCGCCYCRECFRNGAVECLENGDGVACMLCNRQVLAQNCFSIIGSKSNVEEWNHLCRLAEAKYCQENQTLALGGAKLGRNLHRAQGWAMCPDCGISVVFPRGYLFFICRNPDCRSKMCTRCCQVVNTEADMQNCAASNCHATNEDC